MSGRKYGYIRVSSKEQNEKRQIQALLNAGVMEDNIFTDKMSGTDFKRPHYKRIMRLLQSNDVLVIKSIDRLGRNYNEILQQWNEITKRKRAHIKILDMPLLDTTIAPSSLIDVFVRDIVLLILSYNAEQEWQDIKQRQSEGIKSAKLEGKHLGRPKKRYPPKYKEIFEKWRIGEISTKIAMETLRLKRTTFYRLAKAYKDYKGGIYEK